MTDQPRPVSAETVAGFRRWLASETDALSDGLSDAERHLAACVAAGRSATDVAYATQHRDLALRWLENHLDLCREFAAFARRVCQRPAAATPPY